MTTSIEPDLPKRRRRAEGRWRSELEHKYRDFLRLPHGITRPRRLHPSEFASLEDLQRYSEIQDEEGVPADARQDERLERRIRFARAYERWESELAEKYRDLPIPEGFETMEVFPYEAFADVQDLKRFRQIKEEEGVVRARSTGIPLSKMDIFALFPHHARGSGQSLRSLLMAIDAWEVWEGTGPWVGWSKPVWRSQSGDERVFLFPDDWTAFEMRAYAHQWRGTLVTLTLSIREQRLLADRLPDLHTQK